MQKDINYYLLVISSIFHAHCDSGQSTACQATIWYHCSKCKIPVPVYDANSISFDLHAIYTITHNNKKKIMQKPLAVFWLYQ